MNWLNTCVLILAGGWSCLADAPLQLLPDREPQCVFSGDGRGIKTIWHNDSDKTVSVDIYAQILQTSSDTVAPFSQNEWKQLEVLPGQTVMESAPLDFPTVRAGTKFLIQWFARTNEIIGHTEVMVYPTNLLAELKALATGTPVGLLDPENQLKPLLKNLNIDFTDLQNCDVGDFSGRLAILGPFTSRTEMRPGLADQVRALAKKGAAIVWFQPPSEKSDPLIPSFYSLPVTTNAVMIVQPELAENLAGNPQAQFHLLYFCRLALETAPIFASPFAIQP